MNEDHSTEGKPQQKLWTRDFTIITLGSVVSMVGGTMTGFAISIMVLDYTGSTFLYALFNICFQIPMLVCPLLAGPVHQTMEGFVSDRESSRLERPVAERVPRQSFRPRPNHP